MGDAPVWHAQERAAGAPGCQTGRVPCPDGRLCLPRCVGAPAGRVVPRRQPAAPVPQRSHHVSLAAPICILQRRPGSVERTSSVDCQTRSTLCLCAGAADAGAAPMLRRHSWSLQGRTASGQLPASPGALPPPTPPSPQYSPQYPQVSFWRTVHAKPYGLVVLQRTAGLSA